MATSKHTAPAAAQSAPHPPDRWRARPISELSDAIYSELAIIDQVASMLRVTATFARQTGEAREIEELGDAARTLEAIGPILTQMRDALDGIAMGHLPGGQVRS